MANGRPNGRPKAEIDKKQFENLCSMQCTKTEIQAWFEISDKTLDRWCTETYNQSFSDIFKEKREKGKISLRRSQFQLAQKSASMGIWLGKQYLLQTDNVIIEHQSTLEDDALSKSLKELGDKL